MDPTTETSDDEQGVFFLYLSPPISARYLGSMKPFSVSVSQDPYGEGSSRLLTFGSNNSRLMKWTLRTFLEERKNMSRLKVVGKMMFLFPKQWVKIGSDFVCFFGDAWFFWWYLFQPPNSISSFWTAGSLLDAVFWLMDFEHDLGCPSCHSVFEGRGERWRTLSADMILTWMKVATHWNLVWLYMGVSKIGIPQEMDGL